MIFEFTLILPILISDKGIGEGISATQQRRERESTDRTRNELYDKEWQIYKSHGFDGPNDQKDQFYISYLKMIYIDKITENLSHQISEQYKRLNSAVSEFTEAKSKYQTFVSNWKDHSIESASQNKVATLDSEWRKFEAAASKLEAEIDRLNNLGLSISEWETIQSEVQKEKGVDELKKYSEIAFKDLAQVMKDRPKTLEGKVGAGAIINQLLNETNTSFSVLKRSKAAKPEIDAFDPQLAPYFNTNRLYFVYESDELLKVCSSQGNALFHLAQIPAFNADPSRLNSELISDQTTQNYPIIGESDYKNIRDGIEAFKNLKKSMSSQILAITTDQLNLIEKKLNDISQRISTAAQTHTLSITEKAADNIGNLLNEYTKNAKLFLETEFWDAPDREKIQKIKHETLSQLKELNQKMSDEILNPKSKFRIAHDNQLQEYEKNTLDNLDLIAAQHAYVTDYTLLAENLREAIQSGHLDRAKAIRLNILEYQNLLRAIPTQQQIPDIKKNLEESERVLHDSDILISEEENSPAVDLKNQTQKFIKKLESLGVQCTTNAQMNNEQEHRKFRELLLNKIEENLKKEK